MNSPLIACRPFEREVARSERGHVGVHPLLQRLHGSGTVGVPGRCPAQSLLVDLVLPVFGAVDPPRERVPGEVCIAVGDALVVVREWMFWACENRPYCATFIATVGKSTTLLSCPNSSWAVHLLQALVLGETTAHTCLGDEGVHEVLVLGRAGRCGDEVVVLHGVGHELEEQGRDLGAGAPDDELVRLGRTHLLHDDEPTHGDVVA